MSTKTDEIIDNIISKSSKFQDRAPTSEDLKISKNIFEIIEEANYFDTHEEREIKLTKI